LAAGLVAVAGATLCGVAVLAWAAFARIQVIGDIGEWSSSNVDRATRIPLGFSLVAAVAGVAILVRLYKVSMDQASRVRETRSVLDAVSISATGVVEVDDDEPYAHAITGRRPRVLVSSGMLAALGPGGLEAVIAHERSHVRHHHSWFRLAGIFAIAINPLLRWPAHDLNFELERWADEDAAATTGRAEMVEALQRAAFARLAYLPGSPNRRIGFSGHGVPARLEALLRRPPRARWIGFVPYAGIFVLVTGGVVRALERSEDLLEALQNFR
jgi:Zn-dependent protease with chaperone function